MKVVVGTPMIRLGPWEHRWFQCVSKYPHNPKEIVVASENSALLEAVNKQYPYAKTIHFTFERPPWTQERVFAIAEAREQLRKYVCEHKDVEWLFMVDSDVETPPDAFQRLYDIAMQGYNLVFSRQVGLILLMHRDVCESVKWYTCKNFRDRSLYLEETHQIERQIEEYNSWRVNELKKPPIFKVYILQAKWARHKDYPLGVYSK